MINTSMYYVYIYKTPINITVSYMSILADQPFYIGKGHGRRYKDHLSETADTTCNHLKVAVISRLVAQNLTPVIEMYQTELTDAAAKALEIDLINHYGRLIDHAGPLTNKTLGGDGCTGFKHTEETKQLMSIQRKGNIPYNKGITRPGIGGRKLGTKWSESERETQLLVRSQPGYYEFNKCPIRAKKISDSKKGKPGSAKDKQWFNNGVIETYKDICPDGFVKGRLPRLQISKRGMCWYNNGVINKQFKEGTELDGFTRGRINKK